MVIVNECLNDLLTKLSSPKLVLDNVYYLGHPDNSHKDYFYFNNLKGDIIAMVCAVSPKNFGTVVYEALLNSAGHGNKWDKNKALGVKLYSGINGCLLNLNDSGDGFNYELVDKNKFFSNFGNGFNVYRSNIVKVSFENKGKTINLLGLKKM